VAKPKPYNPRQLTKHLRQMAAEVHTIDDDGALITKGEALADLLWKRALGFVDTIRDDEGREKKIEIGPQQWAVQMVYDRMEGRTPQAIDEDETRVSAAERVRELSASRLNGLAKRAVVEVEGSLRTKGPPTRRPKGDTDAE
jgi:hypothetical protein